MARASKPTLLSLDRFARILGINPLHFNGASGHTVLGRQGSCDETWVQYPWQSGDTISREEVAAAIASSEEEIARYLGWYVAPTWTLADSYAWPDPYRHEMASLHYDSRRRQPAIALKRSKLIAGGRRAVTAIALATPVVYSDADGDGFKELATITVATTLAESLAGEVQVFFAGYQAHPAWEARPIWRTILSGGVLTITLYSWLLLNPALWEAFPTTVPVSDIDADDPANYVATVDVYRVYNDTSAVASQLVWRSSCALCGGNGCPACSQTTQDGCLQILDAERGYVVPSPATYADGVWTPATWTSTYTKPDTMRFWYYSGEIAQDYLAGYSNERLSDYWAEAVAWLAVARLPRPICSCTNVVRAVDMMQTDMLINRRDAARFIPANSYVQINPLGTHYGEVRAWLRIQEAMQERGSSI